MEILPWLVVFVLPALIIGTIRFLGHQADEYQTKLAQQRSNARAEDEAALSTLKAVMLEVKLENIDHREARRIMAEMHPAWLREEVEKRELGQKMIEDLRERN